MNPSLIQMINALSSALAKYVSLLFQFEIMPGISLGGFIVVALVLSVIIFAFWR